MASFVDFSFYCILSLEISTILSIVLFFIQNFLLSIQFKFIVRKMIL